MKINQFKKLIKEVLTELGDDSVLPNTQAALKHKNDVSITLISRGVKPGAAYKKVMASLAHAAKMADLEIIHGEVEKNGKSLYTMDDSELKSAEKQFGHSDSSFISKNSSIKPKINMAKLSPEERLAMIEPGEKESEWKAATEKDLSDMRAKVKLKNSKIKAGTYDKNDTSLWTDKEWDAYNSMISNNGAPLDNRKWDEGQWAEFDKIVGGDEEGNWQPHHTKKVSKPLANVGAGIGNLRQTS